MKAVSKMTVKAERFLNMHKVWHVVRHILRPVVEPVVAAARIPYELVHGNFLVVLHEPLVVFAAVFTAINASTDRSTWGFVAAGVAALLRSLVSPVVHP